MRDSPDDGDALPPVLPTIRPRIVVDEDSWEEESGELDAVALFEMRARQDEPEEALDPVALFEQMRAREVEPEDTLDSVALFEQMRARELEPGDSLDPVALFEQMRAREDELEEALDPVALFERMRAREVEPEDTFDPVALFEQMRAREDEPEEVLDPVALFEQMRAREVEPEETFDPVTLFEQMRARETEFEAQAEEPPASLPDPEALFREMVARERGMPLPLPDDELPDPGTLFQEMTRDEAGPAPVRPPKVSFFNKLKAAFGKKTQPEPVETLPPPPLPDAAAMFEALEVEEQLEALEYGLPSVEAAPLPALPDLDALRAELDAEMLEELEPDLLGELSGPERFVDTVSDMTFHAGTLPTHGASAPSSPSPPVLTPPSASTTPSRTEDSPYRPAAGTRSEVPESRPEVLAPAHRPVSSPPPSPRPDSPPVAPVYRPTTSTRDPIKVAGAAKVAATAVATSRRLWKSGVSISRTALAILTRQLAAMLRSGIPLHQSLAFCAESDPRAAPVLEQVVSKVESGYSLSNALREFPDSFDSVYVGLVQSGEMSGRINEMLEKLADVLERELELRKRLISVVTYPAMLLMVSLLGTLGFIFFVLPQLMPLFQDLKVDLPLPTQILLSLREVLLPATVLVGLIAFLIFLTRKRIKYAIASRPVLQRRLANMALNIPVLGPVYEKIVTSRVLYSMSSMLEVGVTMNQALARSEESAGNAQVAFRLARARQDLSDGATVSEAFRDNSVFPNSALHLISAGEESARTVEMFNFVARNFDDEVEYAMQSAAGYLEPIIMVVMGLIVGFITIAAAMPTIQLLQNFG